MPRQRNVIRDLPSATVAFGRRSSGRDTASCGFLRRSFRPPLVDVEAKCFACAPMSRAKGKGHRTHATHRTHRTYRTHRTRVTRPREGPRYKSLKPQCFLSLVPFSVVGRNKRRGTVSILDVAYHAARFRHAPGHVSQMGTVECRNRAAVTCFGNGCVHGAACSGLRVSDGEIDAGCP